MTAPTTKCPRCGKEPYKGRITKGVCFNCYRKYFWKQKLITCKRCGRKKPNQAFGYCAGCYNLTFHLDNTKAHNHKKYHNIEYKTYKKITERCLVCGFDKVVELHHLDENHNNNSEKNMIGLCPNHHKMLHNFKFREEVLTQIQEALADDKSPLLSEETEVLEINEPEALAPQPLAIPIKNKLNMANGC